MKLNAKRTILFLSVVAMMVIPAKGESLKEYYEKQKAEFAPSFKAPALGSEIMVKMASGQERKGILMGLTTSEVSLMNDTGATVSYKPTALHESSRVLLFADDYAGAKAMEKTREYKEQLHLEGVAEEQANTHEASISVTAKVDKDSNKEVEEDERENEQTGTTTTTTTTTRTYTEVQNLKVTIANNTTHSDTYSLNWYVYAKPTGSDEIADDRASLHDSGTKSITVGGRKRVQELISSQAIERQKETTTRESSNSGNSGDARERESGKEGAGWLVVLKYGGEIMDAKASSKSMLTEEWLNKL